MAEKEMSLAELLEIEDPEHHPRHAGTGIDEQRLGKLTPKQFCKRILQSPEFRTYIKNGIIVGDLPPAVVIRLMDIGWGKPVEHLEVKERTDLVDLTPEQVELKLKRVQKMLSLVRRAQRQEPDDVGDSVH